jgi:hypothetical protein
MAPKLDGAMFQDHIRYGCLDFGNPGLARNYRNRNYRSYRIYRNYRIFRNNIIIIIL